MLKYDWNVIWSNQFIELKYLMSFSLREDIHVNSSSYLILVRTILDQTYLNPTALKIKRASSPGTFKTKKC